mgnify:CR=1 FL=1
MPTIYSGISELRGAVHQYVFSTGTVSGEFMITGMGDSSYQSQMTGLLTNHIGREFYTKLNQFDITATYKDQLDAGFRPTTFTGLYCTGAY